MANELTLVLDAQATLGEGPIWDNRAQVLWWIDIVEETLHRFDPATKTNETHKIGQMIGTVVPRKSGGLAVAVEQGFASFDPATDTLKVLHDPEADLEENRFNDGKCDPRGRFWAGTMSKSEKPEAGSLYCLDSQGQCTRHLTEITVANGIVWTADEATMYYIDSPTRKVDAFDFNPETGALSNRRTVVAVPDGMGYPDGMSIDREGHLWVALWDGWGVARFDPQSGRLLQKIDVPAAHVTACAFGGPDLTDLYITSARDRIKEPEKQPHAGGLFHYKSEVPGTVSFPYSG